jgi:hypothetical protein
MTSIDWNRKHLPDIADHAFMRMLREQCNTTKPMAKIAAELGVDVGDLCDWIMAYTEKPRRKPVQNQGYTPVVHDGGGDDWSLPERARKFEAWRKAKEGTAETRRMLEAARK